MTLALRLGKTLAELGQVLTARELTYWMAFDRISPISDQRADIQAAQIASAIYQSQGIKTSINDVLLDFAGEDVTTDPDEAQLQQFFNQLM